MLSQAAFSHYHPGSMLFPMKFPVPSARPALKRNLIMISYYHRFLPDIATKLASLHEALYGRGRNIFWTDNFQLAFEPAKFALSLTSLRFHTDVETSITVEASDKAIDAQLGWTAGHRQIGQRQIGCLSLPSLVS